MPFLLTLRHAARLLGVSPGRLYRAIDDGQLTASPGGGPGKPTLVSLEALQTFCRSEGLRVPEATEVKGRTARLERSGRDERAVQDERSPASMDEVQNVQALAAQRVAEQAQMDLAC